MASIFGVELTPLLFIEMLAIFLALKLFSIFFSGLNDKVEVSKDSERFELPASTEPPKESNPEESKQEGDDMENCANCSDEFKRRELLYFENLDSYVCPDCIADGKKKCPKCNSVIRNGELSECEECNEECCDMCSTGLEDSGNIICDVCVKKALADMPVVLQQEPVRPVIQPKPVEATSTPEAPVEVPQLSKEKENSLYKSEMDRFGSK